MRRCQGVREQNCASLLDAREIGGGGFGCAREILGSMLDATWKKSLFNENERKFNALSNGIFKI